MKKLKGDALGRPDIKDYKNSTKIPLIVVLDNIRSMNNVGSVFRSCDAFGARRLYLCGITPRPPHRDIYKTALGATESVDWDYREDIMPLVADLKSHGYKLAAAEQTTHSLPLHQFQMPTNEPLALVLGNEIEGVNGEVLKQCDFILEIKQWGTKHSLNIAVAAGIFLFHLRSFYSI